MVLTSKNFIPELYWDFYIKIYLLMLIKGEFKKKIKRLRSKNHLPNNLGTNVIIYLFFKWPYVAFVYGQLFLKLFSIFYYSPFFISTIQYLFFKLLFYFYISRYKFSLLVLLFKIFYTTLNFIIQNCLN